MWSLVVFGLVVASSSTPLEPVNVQVNLDTELNSQFFSLQSHLDAATPEELALNVQIGIVVCFFGILIIFCLEKSVKPLEMGGLFFFYFLLFPFFLSSVLLPTDHWIDLN